MLQEQQFRMTRLYIFIFSLLYSLVNGQKFELKPLKTPLEGNLGEELTLTWEMLNYPDGKPFGTATVYMDGNNTDKVLFVHDPKGPLERPYAKTRFGNRITAVLSMSPPKYEVTLKSLHYSDTGTFHLRVIIDTDKFPNDNEVITISKINDPKKPGGGDPKKPGGGDPEKGSNTGAIVGGVIGGIVLIVLIVLGVLYFLRWKKNRGSS